MTGEVPTPRGETRPRHTVQADLRERKLGIRQGSQATDTGRNEANRQARMFEGTVRRSVADPRFAPEEQCSRWQAEGAATGKSVSEMIPTSAGWRSSG